MNISYIHSSCIIGCIFRSVKSFNDAVTEAKAVRSTGPSTQGRSEGQVQVFQKDRQALAAYSTVAGILSSGGAQPSSSTGQSSPSRNNFASSFGESNALIATLYCAHKAASLVQQTLKNTQGLEGQFKNWRRKNSRWTKGNNALVLTRAVRKALMLQARRRILSQLDGFVDLARRKHHLDQWAVFEPNMMCINNAS